MARCNCKACDERRNPNIDNYDKARYIWVSAHCSDSFNAELLDEVGGRIQEYDGYVLGLNDYIGGGDELEMFIDLHTGQIVKIDSKTKVVTPWVAPTTKQLKEEFSGAGFGRCDCNELDCKECNKDDHGE